MLVLFCGPGVGRRLIDELEELVPVDDFDEGRAFGLAGGDLDGGGVLDACALAEGEGQFDLVVGGELLGELEQDFEGGNGGLAGEDGVTVFVTQLL